jgi:hypothetical protein
LDSDKAKCSFATIRRCDVVLEIDSQLFAVGPGEVVGPHPVGASSYVLGCLLKLTEPDDDEETRAAAEQRLFDQWLAKRRREASVTWHWGRTSDMM